VNLFFRNGVPQRLEGAALENSRVHMPRLENSPVHMPRLENSPVHMPGAGTAWAPCSTSVLCNTREFQHWHVRVVCSSGVFES
jgi:hypothetical protein